MAKAIALLSGGLDSTLATKLVMEQGIEVEAATFVTVFCTCTAHGKGCLAGKSAADKLGIKLKVFEVSKEYFEIVKNPRHGYGSNMNPCLDCRIFIFKKAAQYMRETGASFLITGEVLGQRPMSQRKDAMRVIERDSGLEGLILRPLSAGLMEPTIPEKEGAVDRKRLLAIEGRSRKPQIELARELHINDYPCPAGGCLLTDPGFANRMRGLIKHKPDFVMNDVLLLKVGRHFRLSPDAKFIVGRNEKENDKLIHLAVEGDISFQPAKVKGPVGIGRGIFNKDNLSQASSIIARYSDKDEGDEIEVQYKKIPAGSPNSIKALPETEEALSTLRI
jgi:tRNA U34 2-thiouridine synthase MnmA/TrmU